MINDVKLKEFIKKIGQNAPLSSYLDSERSLKFPYKPALIISIIENIDLDNLFNKDISLLSNQKIVKSYYDILMNSESMCSAFSKMKGKVEWSLGYNESNFKKVLNNIFENPAQKLIVSNSNIWEINVNNKVIKINYDFKSDDDKQELKDILLDVSYACLKKCIPEYKDLSINEIYYYQEFMFQRIYTSSDKNTTESKKRQYQHIFAKAVKDRDGQCVVCKTDLSEILEACHIKPFSICDNQIDQYSIENGLTMCRNHHRLFDLGFFTFSNDWELLINNEKLKDFNKNIITDYYNFYKDLQAIKPFNNKYIEFHRNEIFKK